MIFVIFSLFFKDCSNPLLHRCTTNHSLGFSVAFDALSTNLNEKSEFFDHLKNDVISVFPKSKSSEVFE